MNDWFDTLKWGRIPVPLEHASQHFMVAGASGSGKTLLLDSLLCSALYHKHLNSAWRFLVYDPKGDAIPKLGMMLRGFRPIILNPLDNRCLPWAIQDDIDSPAAAREFAKILVPDEAQSNSPFFAYAVQDLLSGLIGALTQRSKERFNWTLRDVLWLLFNTATESGKRDFVSLVGEYEDTRRLTEYFADGQTASNIRMTIMAKLSAFEPVAAVWHRRLQNGARSFSFSEWLNNRHAYEARDDFELLSQHVAVIGTSETARAPVDAINRAMFARFSQFALEASDIPHDLEPERVGHTFVFLDELRDAGHLDSIHRLMIKGRSKGLSMSLGFQDVLGLREAYGRERADEMLGQCSTFAVLKLRSPATAEWAASLFGDYYQTAETQNQSFGSSTSIGSNQKVERRQKMLNSDFFDLPTTSPENGLTGYFQCGMYSTSLAGSNFNPRLHVPWDTLVSWKVHVNDSWQLALRRVVGSSFMLSQEELERAAPVAGPIRPDNVWVANSPVDPEALRLKGFSVEERKVFGFGDPDGDEPPVAVSEKGPIPRLPRTP